ncbi:EpsG family protein [Providencia huaxiensis]|uniref:EpsG family protein n=1 Tax=Providencia huaxiensis TaxID=2027290 RepID=UPI0034DD0D57
MYILFTFVFFSKASHCNQAFAGLATAQIIKGNNFKFIISIIIGALFHTSILILIPFYILRKINAPRYLLIIITISASMIIYESEVLIDILNNSFLASTKYGYYAESKFNTSAEIGSGLGVAIKINPSINYNICEK